LRKKPVSIQERHISVAKKAKKTSKKKASPKKPAAAKKKQAKKTGKKKVLKRRRKRTLTAEEIQHFKELLLKKRAELVGDVSSIESEALKKSRLDAAGDLSSMPIHMADIGTDNFEQEFALGLMDSERKILAEINDALGRIDEGVYGTCEVTGKFIAKARLEANPWARYCIKYATMVEQGLVREGEKIAAEPGEEYEDDDELDQIDELEELDEDDDEE
jgi:RNA polymerase-binding protein DksA